jgi:2Fe-2S ferredoxin
LKARSRSGFESSGDEWSRAKTDSWSWDECARGADQLNNQLTKAQSFLIAGPRNHGETGDHLMAKITFIDAVGAVQLVEGKSGLSVMEVAAKNNIAGIDADCGGACACATCHVYVTAPWQARVGRPGAMEESMLDFAEGVAKNSRLACQIKITEDLDGLVLQVAPRQG